MNADVMSETASTAFKEDHFDRKLFSQKLERYLMIEHGFVPDGLVVSLNAPFGAGKTTFLTMWADDMRFRRVNDPSVPIVLMLNAWESDYGGDPLLAIIAGLTRGLEAHSLKDKPDAENRLREAAKDIAWFGLSLANNVASKWTGIDPLEAADLADAKKKERKPTRPDFLRLYEERIAALQTLKTELTAIFGSETPKAFIFVDELDRCRPDYAIQYLETVKHVFDIHGLVFVLGIDYDQLACSACALFGAKLNTAEYFRKFFQRAISLPEINDTGIQTVVDAYVDRYLKPNGKRSSLMNLRTARQHMSDLIRVLAMTPRQIQEMFRVVGHATGDHLQKGGQIFWGVSATTVFLAALKVAQNKRYHELVRGAHKFVELGRLIQTLGLRNPRWWFCTLVSGQLNEDTPELDLLESAMKELGLLSGDKKIDFQKDFREFMDAWDFSTGNRIQEVYSTIESASSFG